MNHKAPKGGWKLGRDSFSKMVCWFKDGNMRTMFSLDWRHRYSRYRDRNLGLARFRKKITEYGNLAETIEVYDTTSGEIIGKFYEGIQRPLDQTPYRKGTNTKTPTSSHEKDN